MRSIITGFRDYLDGMAATENRPVSVDAEKQGATMPYVVLALDSAENYDSLGDQDDSLREETFSVTVYAREADDCHRIGDAIVDGLKNYAGAMGDDRVAESIVCDDGQSGFAQDEFGTPPGRFFVTKSISIQHSPAS